MLTYSGGEYTLENHPDGYIDLVYTVDVKVTTSYVAGSFTLTVTYNPTLPLSSLTWGI